MYEILTGNTPEKWEEIKTHPFYAKDREMLISAGEEYLKNPPKALLWSDYSRFMRDGDRKCYEKIYFDRRRRVAYLAILTKLYGEKYLDALCDTMWLIMDESTWVVPAHMADMLGDADKRITHLDLFSTETGALLAETYHILGDIIPKQVSDRLVSMVKERTIDPFFRYHYWWMNGENNWASVCVSQIALCIMYLGTPEDFRRAEPEFNRIMNLFLSSYGKDGCCLEGLGYWSYGFGTFLNYADAVKNYSSNVNCLNRFERGLSSEKIEKAHNLQTGVIDYFTRDDVKKAAVFSSAMRLNGDYAVCFSDASEKYRYPRSHFYVINKHYPGLLAYPDVSLSTYSISAGSHNIIRYFLWSDPDAEYGEKLKNGTMYYEEGQWFIRNCDKYSIAAKGGHNNEPHNHNDIGTFMMTTQEEIILCDTGSGEYTRQYFDNRYRYDYLVNSSRGHSLPIVNGNYQSMGTPKAEVTEHTDSVFELNIKDSYKDPTLKSLSRRYECSDNKVILTDSFEFFKKPDSIIERFVSFTEPREVNGEVFVGKNSQIVFDKAQFDLSVSAEEYSGHGAAPMKLYFIDFKHRDPLEKEKAVFEIVIL
ncbi:MAG: hypothetical protein E7633_08370 [Ruminococcaceae bacterium]|nr:hypothetical protein [Oscillospiraceae bacterium]